MAKGAGKGAVEEGNIVAGSAFSAGMAICFCVFGIPVILTGIIMVAVTSSGSTPWVIGLVLLIISALCLVAGIIVIVLLCTGVCEKKNRTNPQMIIPNQPAVIYHSNVIMPPVYGGTYGVPGQAYPMPPAHGSTEYNQGGAVPYSEARATAPPSYPHPDQQPSASFLPQSSAMAPPPYKQ